MFISRCVLPNAFRFLPRNTWRYGFKLIRSPAPLVVRTAVHTNTVARNNAITRFNVFLILIFSPPVKKLCTTCLLCPGCGISHPLSRLHRHSATNARCQPASADRHKLTGINRLYCHNSLDVFLFVIFLPVILLPVSLCPPLPLSLFLAIHPFTCRGGKFPLLLLKWIFRAHKIISKRAK